MNPSGVAGFRALIFVKGVRKEKRFFSIADAIEWCVEMGKEDGRGYEMAPQGTRARPGQGAPRKRTRKEKEPPPPPDLSHFPQTDMEEMEHRKAGLRYVTPFSFAEELGIDIPDDYMPELKLPKGEPKDEYPL